MKSKDGSHLFELIKSMTKSEKRFFKLSAQKHEKEEESIYIKLFDAIEKQREYDENAIREAFKNESFVGRLPMEKYNLYKILLRVLNDYNHEETIDFKIYEALKSARILYSKMLFDQALKVLLAAKKIAFKYDKYILLAEILEVERHCVNSLADPEIIEKELPLIYEQSEYANKMAANLNSYVEIFKNYMFESKNYFSVRNNKDKIRLQEIFEKVVNSENDENCSLEEFIRKNNLLSYYYLKIGNVEEAYKANLSVVKKFEANPERLIENPERYALNIHNMINRCDLLKRKEESDYYYNKMHNIFEDYKIKPNITLSFMIFRMDMNRVNRSIRYVEIEEGLDLILRIEKQMKEVKLKMSWETETLFYYNAAYLCFIGKEYKKALKYLNKVLHNNRKNYRNDVLGFARIMNLILHYELNNFDLIPYAVRSTYRFLEKSDMLNKTEKAIYKFMNYKLPKFVNEREEEQLPAFVELRDELTEIMKDPYELKALEYFDILSWLESKLQKREFEEVMKEKAAVLLY